MVIRKKKILVAVLLLALLALPARAVFIEKDINRTLGVLRYELKQEYTTMSGTRDRLKSRQKAQHLQMVSLQKKCNELSLMLYSQSQEFTFDMTYALKTVTKEYEDFNRQRMPFDEIVTDLDIEINRYARLVEALRRLPPSLSYVKDLPDSLKYHNDSVNFDRPLLVDDIKTLSNFKKSGTQPDDTLHHISKDVEDELRSFELDAQGRTDRDSCLFYAISMLKMFSESKDRIVDDSRHYDEASLRLKESYDYACERYKIIQKKIFVDGQSDYWKILKSFPSQFRRARIDAKSKYSSIRRTDSDSPLSKSEWRGPIVLGFIAFVIVWLLIASGLSVIVMRILRRKVKRMQAPAFKSRILCLNYLCGAVIFAISMMVMSKMVNHNFISLASRHLLVFAWLLAAILLSLFIRLDDSQIKSGIKMYLPVVVLGLVVIGCRIAFVPNRIINIFMPPALLLFCVWQILVCKECRKKVKDSDSLLGLITLIVILVTAVASFAGYVLLGIEIMMWWLFQLSAIETIMAISQLLDNYEKSRSFQVTDGTGRKGDNIGETWFLDLVSDCVIPVIAALSIPFCLSMAANVFDLTEVCKEFFYKSLFNLTSDGGQEILKISVFNVLVIVVLYFIFSYLGYVVKAVYHDFRLNKESHRNGGAYIHTNEINFTLANNVISILVWGVYVVSIILILKIPTGAISIVFAGLATGLGLAMKDILNNFIYGIQLMSGRLRVGDYVECDGIRGKVSAISYQSTQIETLEGAVISYLNTSLFDKNFKNLTKNNAYEYVKIVVGVSYGSDVEKVREVLLDALKKVQTRDRFGRDVIDAAKGVSVVIDALDESSVNIAVKQYVLVSERNYYIAQAQEVIYNALNEAGISIPFPQLDVNVKEMP